MVYDLSLYDYWMPSYLEKRQIVQYLLIYPTHIGYPIYTRYSASILHISYTYHTHIGYLILGFRTDRIGSRFWRSDPDSTRTRLGLDPKAKIIISQSSNPISMNFFCFV